MSDLIGKHWRALAITGGAASVVITLWYSRPSKKQRRRATRALAKEAGSVRSVNSISQVTEPTEYGVPSGDPRKVGFAAKRLPTSIDVIIIGSGIGGLACAATLAKSGVKCVVLEQHDVAGGSTHTYESTANGVTVEFDTGLHYVGGKVWLPTTTSSQILNWMSDGGIQWQLMDNIYDIAVFNGERYKMPAGKQALREKLISWFPAEEAAIDRYFEAVQGQQSSAGLFFAARLLIGMLPSFCANLLAPLMSKHLSWSDRTLSEVLTECGCSGKLQGVIAYHYGNMGFPPHKLCFAAFAMMANHYFEGAAYPSGGSGVIAKDLCAAIVRAGSRVLVRAPVERILVDEGRATGVALRNGSTIFARRGVVSAAGARVTFASLCPMEKKLEEARSEVSRIGPSVQHLSLFICLEHIEDLPATNFWVFPGYEHDDNHNLHQEDHSRPFGAVFISFPSAKDPTWQSRYPGTSTCHIITPTSLETFATWQTKRIKHRGSDYEELKKEFTSRLMEVLYENMPQCRGKVNFSELGTPLSTQYYLGAPDGESYGMAPSCERYRSKALYPGTGVQGLWLAGQDTLSSGVMGAFCSGYLTAMMVKPSMALSHASWLAKLWAMCLPCGFSL